jgi:membrane protein YqaA with SNARE-associated domain
VNFLRHIAAVLFHLGGPGLLVMGVLDSSFLFMPLGNDLLMVAMTASRHQRMWYYAVMATAGSVAGCLIMDLLFRRGGEKALEKHLPARRLDYIREKVSKRAGWTLAFASLMPPPFPFTPFVIGAAALQYPRNRLLGVIAATRLVRFSVEGLLAQRFGPHILGFAKNTAVQWTIGLIVVVSMAGSVWSLYGWIKRSRRAAPLKTRTAGG